MNVVSVSTGYSGPLVYKASSPDEGALVQAAAKMGFEFRGKRGKNYFVKMPVEAAQLFSSKIPKNAKEVGFFLIIVA
jgi:magnesium-transporting ATPase (P-type)